MQPNQANTGNNLEIFLNNLIAMKGIADVDEEARAAIRKDLQERLDEFIMARTIAELSDADVATVDIMLEEGKSIAEVRAFAQEHIADYTNFLTSTLLEFQDVYLSGK